MAIEVSSHMLVKRIGYNKRQLKILINWNLPGTEEEESHNEAKGKVIDSEIEQQVQNQTNR